MRISRSNLLITAALGFVVICLFAERDHDRKEQQTKLTIAILGDIVEGRSTGPLHSDQGQFVCLDPGDAFRAGNNPTDDPSGTKSLAIQTHLIDQWRCITSDKKDGFDMTAEGRERFTTPSGRIDLWATDH